MISLSTINNFSLQQIFEFIAYNLLKQGSKSVGDDGLCRYRGPGGQKCAVGFCMSDDEYLHILEGHSIESPVFKRFGIDADHLRLLGHFQIIHDSMAVEGWELCVLELAQNHAYAACIDLDQLRVAMARALQ